MPKRLLLTLAALILLFSLTPALAQTDWCYFFDFTLDEQGWSVGPGLPGQYLTGQGYADTYPPGFDGIYLLSPLWVDTGVMTELTVYGNFFVSPGGFLMRDADTDPEYCPTPDLPFDVGDQWLYPHFCDDTLSSGGQMEIVYDACIFDDCNTDLIIQGIRMEGEGDSPMGESNCGGANASFTADPDSGAAPLEVEFTDTSFTTGEITAWNWDFDDGDTSTEQNPTHTFEEPGEYEVVLSITTTTGDDNYMMVITVTDGGVGGGTWIRPLLEADEYGDNPLISNNDLVDLVFEGSTDPIPALSTIIVPGTVHRVSAFSDDAGDFVMAAQGGEIVDIEYTSPAMCFLWGVVIEQACYFGGPDSGAQLFNLYKFPITFDVQTVTIELEDGTHLRYMVENANHYVSLNQVIEAGCVLGETIQADRLPLSQAAATISTIVANFTGLEGVLNTGSDGQFGVTLIELRDETEVVPMLPLIQNLTVYNTDAVPCNANPNFKDCLVTNPELKRDAESWIMYGDAEPGDAGVLLHPDAYMQQVVNLPEDGDFTLRVGFYYFSLDLLDGRTGEERELTFRVGTFTASETVEMTTDYQEVAIEVVDPGEDVSGLGYTVRIANTGGNGGIVVRAVCLTTEDHELNPRNCYFQNPEFDGIVGWSPNYLTVGAGFVQLFNLQSISQTVSLQPNEDDSPRTYRLEVDARIVPAPGETYEDDEGEALLDYSWEGNTGEVGSLDLQWNTPGNPGYPDAFQTLSVDIEVDEPTSGAFNLVAVVTDNPTIRGIAISRACLTADPEGPPTSGVSGPFQTTCSTIPIPTDNGVGAWTMYHWRNLDKFFNCKLMVLLNKWFNVFDQFRRTALLFMRYNVALVQRAVDWLTTAMWWLNGHLRNIAIGQITTVSSGATFWDVLLALINGVLSPLLNAILEVVALIRGIVEAAVILMLAGVVAAIALIVLFVAQILNLLLLGRELLSVLINAFNGAPLPSIPLLPLCSVDPQSSPICVGLWVLENTIFSGPGSIAIPLLVSIGSIHLILWIIGEIKRTVMRMATVS